MCVRLCTLLSAARGLRASLPLNALCSRVVNQPHGSQVAAARSTRLPVAFASGRLQPRARPRAGPRAHRVPVPALYPPPDPQASADGRRPRVGLIYAAGLLNLYLCVCPRQISVFMFLYIPLRQGFFSLFR